MKKIAILILTAITFLAMLTACTKLSVTWLDGDGSVLYSEKIEKDAAIPEKPLPEDNDDWNYIEWKSEPSDGKKATITAYREAKDKYEWRDADGTLLHKESVFGGSPAPSFDLPKDTDIFDYEKWNESLEDGVKVFTAFGYSGKTVLYKDADGTILYTVFVRNGESTPERYLPNDTIDWHYTQWKEQNGDFIAERIAKEKVHWLDVDGKELFVDGIIPGEEIKTREFPKDSKKWVYKEWVDVTESGGEKTFMAIADINPKYFKGNVFQVVAKDIYGIPQKVGSGFVFNSNGWFITNYHVIENAVSADAIFEIENYASGDSFTTLKISHAYFSSPEKDIFIGRIEDYKTISSHYQNIPMVRDFSVGEKVYSVGYPSASVNMEIHGGEIVAENHKNVNTLYQKLVKGATYIPNTAYIAPGSSGGILINEKLEVVGITSGVFLSAKNDFILGAAIEVFNFQNTANNVTINKEKEFVDFFYPLNADMIKFFQMGETHEKCVGLKSDETGIYYQYIDTIMHDNGEEAIVVNIYASGLMVFTRTYVWSDAQWLGDVCINVLTGIYNGNPSCINSFSYAYSYAWPSGNGYALSSDEINYSTDVSQTLKNYKVTEMGTTVDQDNIEYAKKQFNKTYVKLTEFLKTMR